MGDAKKRNETFKKMKNLHYITIVVEERYEQWRRPLLAVPLKTRWRIDL
jgi:hypothetical protein